MANMQNDNLIVARNCNKCGALFSAKRCPDCVKAYSKEYYVKNSEKVKAKTAKYRAEHPDALKIWRRKNPGIAKQYYLKNIQTERLRSALYYKNNTERAREYFQKWRKLNLVNLRIKEQNRRALKASNGGVLSKDLVDRLFKLQKGKCACCGEPLGNDFHMDHIMPLALGGANEDSNIQLLKQKCNNQKHIKDPIEFMQLRGFLL